MLHLLTLCTLLLWCTCIVQGEENVTVLDEIGGFNGTDQNLTGSRLWICNCFDDGEIDLTCVYRCVQKWGDTCFWALTLCPSKVPWWLETWTKGMHLVSYQHSVDGVVLDWKIDETFLRGWGIEKIFEYGRCAVDLVPREAVKSDYYLKAACTWDGVSPGEVPVGDLGPPSNLMAFVSDRTFDSIDDNRTLEVTFDAPERGPVPSLQEVECLFIKNRRIFMVEVVYFHSTESWGSPVVFSLEGAAVGEWSCRVRGQQVIGGRVKSGPWSNSLLVNTSQTNGSKPVVQISHANYWGNGMDAVYRLELDGTHRGTVLDMQYLPTHGNESNYASYDSAGQNVYSHYPFSFDHVSRYRYETRQRGQLIIRVDPYDSKNETIIYNGSRHGKDDADGGDEIIGHLEYDSTHHTLFFTAQPLDTKGLKELWWLKMINLSTSAIDTLQMDLLSPAVTLIFDSHSTDHESPAVLYLNFTGLWSMSLLNGSWYSDLLVRMEEMQVGDLSTVTHLAADQAYVYYVDSAEGLHIFDRRSRLARTISVVVGASDQDTEPKLAVATTPYWPIRHIHSLHAYRPENRPFSSDPINCFFPKITDFSIRMTGENSADAILSLQSNPDPNCQKIPSRPPYECRLILRPVGSHQSVSEAESPVTLSTVSRNETVQVALRGLEPGRRYNCTVMAGPYNWTFFGVPPATAETSFDAIYTVKSEWDAWVWVLLICLILAVLVVLILLFLLFARRKRDSAVQPTLENWQHQKLELERSGLVPFVPETELTLEGVIGTGKYGDVYKGRRKRSYEEIVLKLLNEDQLGSDNERMKTQFYREALIWARLHKRNTGEIARGGGDRILDLVAICFSRGDTQAHDTGTGTVLIAEYMNGGRCDEYLKRYRQHLDRNDALKIAEDIATACLYMSDRGYVHGDLTLRSVYVRMRTDGSRKPEVAKLAGFHTSKHVEENYVSFVRERYCAPEAFSGTTTEKTDVWSFGVLVWELFMFFEVPENCAPLPYYPPIGPHAPPGIVRRFVSEEKRRIECPNHWPSTLIGILESCWLYEATARPTFNDLAQALEAVQFNESAPRGPPENGGETEEPSPKESVRPKKAPPKEDKVPLLDPQEPK